MRCYGYQNVPSAAQQPIRIACELITFVIHAIAKEKYHKIILTPRQVEADHRH